jgi:hypothetical protein
MMGVDILGDRIICPSCERVVEADLFFDRSGALRCGQCAPRPRRRRSPLIPFGVGRSGAVPLERRPSSRGAL